MGRPTKDPEVRYTQKQDGSQMAIARFTLAVDRRGRVQEGQQSADFISCVAFGKLGEFAEKYIVKGRKYAIVGRIQTGSYTNKDGAKVYTTEVMVDECEFCDSKPDQVKQAEPGFMDIPDGIEQDLPFK